MKALLSTLFAVLLFISCNAERAAPIDREALVTRNNPHVTEFDSLSTLSVGNG